jgi:hypothetical protein
MLSSDTFLRRKNIKQKNLYKLHSFQYSLKSAFTVKYLNEDIVNGLLDNG